MAVTPHPAQFSAELYSTFLDITIPLSLVGIKRWLDPFAGVGNFLDLIPADCQAESVGVEIEPEWAGQRKGVILGDSRHLVRMFGPDSFDGVISSPVYPNGMTDNFNAGAKSGRAYRRQTYRQSLGRPLSIGSTAGVGRGLTKRHNQMHTEIAREIVQVLRPGGHLLWNVKNVIVKSEIVDVVGWWKELWAALGLLRWDVKMVPCPGYRYGQNRDLRVEEEAILCFVKPDDWMMP